MADLSGYFLGRYHIAGRLGQGGMATVYKAYDTRLERHVAVKVLRTDQFPPAALERIIKRFEREARALARLSHPNIVHINDYGEKDGVSYLVMDYLPGGTLKDRLVQPMPWRDALTLLIPIARALEFAHENNIVHRDIKPSNILLTHMDQPMLTDFGIAKLLENEETATLTGTGLGIGTPGYMAPEQWTGQTSPQSDIYSLGVVLYELVTGRKPYIANTPAAILLKQATEPLPPPGQFLPGLPLSLERLLIKALERNPQNRYKNMKAIIAAMQDLLSGLPTRKDLPASHGKQKTFQQMGSVSRPVKNSAGLLPRFTARIFLVVLGMLAITFLFIAGSNLMREKTLAVPTPAPATSPAAIIPVSLQTGTGLAPANTPLPEKTRLPEIASLTPSPLIPSNTPVPFVAGVTLVSPVDGMLLLPVPAGEFAVGSRCGDIDCGSLPIRTAFVDAFWVDQTEVSNRMYQTCVGVGVCAPPQNTSLQTVNDYYFDSKYADYPVVFVTQEQARSYCRWAGRRLPSPLEREKAARGADSRKYPWGNDFQGYEANFCDASCPFGKAETRSDGYVYTAPVNSFKSFTSPYGALNMSGNVGEILSDGSTRGGSWKSPVRSLFTYTFGDPLETYSYNDPQVNSNDVGFRCAVGPTEANTPVIP